MKKGFILVLLFALCSCDANNISKKPAIEGDFTRIIACSDFQNENGHSVSIDNMQKITEALSNDGITKADAFFSCGDYDYNTTDNIAGINMMNDLMSNYTSQENMYFVQGNHEEEVFPGEHRLRENGDNDPEHNKYGVFVVNEDMYMYKNKVETTCKETANELKSYLDSKLNEKYSKPIFILSHLGLNYNMRTYYNGDAKYARYLFDVINDAGKKGLNIFYLYGHDHSNGWDDYVGGSSVFLRKGDDILIAEYSMEEFKTHKLNFTYLNAGYVGYYRDVNLGSDTTLTMTLIDIYEDNVEIYRYSKDGIHNLKSILLNNTSMQLQRLLRILKNVQNETHLLNTHFQ